MSEKNFIRFYKKLPKEILEKLYNLDWDKAIANNDNRSLGAYFNENGEVLGAFDLKLGEPIIVERAISYPICIERFEVVPEHRNEGKGVGMYEDICRKFNPMQVTVNCLNPDEDNGASKKWWTCIGFTPENDDYYCTKLHRSFDK